MNSLLLLSCRTVTKADAMRIMNDPRLKKISVPIRKQLVNKHVFLEYLKE